VRARRYQSDTKSSYATLAMSPESHRSPTYRSGQPFTTRPGRRRAPSGCATGGAASRRRSVATAGP